VIISPGRAAGWPRQLLTLVWLPIIVAAGYFGEPPVAHPLAAAAAGLVAAAGWLILVLRPSQRVWLSPLVGVLATAVGGVGMVAAIGNWSSAVAFCFVAVASAGGRLPRPGAVAVMVGVAAALTLILEHHAGLLGMVIVVLLLVMALVAGIGRRDTALRAEQRELALVAVTRAQEEHIRAAALAERARIARDVHDALAHSLSALAVQLQGARLMVLRDGAPPDTVAQVERAQRLATDGLAEARRAVSALRADPVTLATGLRELVDAHPHATLEITGEIGPGAVRAGAGSADPGGVGSTGARAARAGANATDADAIDADAWPIGMPAARGSMAAARGSVASARGSAVPADTTTADTAAATAGVGELAAAGRETVLRVAQEALSNTRKHAPDAPVVVRLHRDDTGTELSIRDYPGTPPTYRGPDGYGLIGMAERAALIGAEWDAGPTEDGWLVRLRIPR
jgi:signal transduction histidine kinase